MLCQQADDGRGGIARVYLGGLRKEEGRVVSFHGGCLCQKLSAN